MSAVLAAYGIAFEQAGDGWFAEGRFRAGFPLQTGFGRTRSRALAQLKQQFNTWRH